MSTKRDIRKQKRTALKKKKRAEKRRTLKAQKIHQEDFLDYSGPPGPTEDPVLTLLESDEEKAVTLPDAQDIRLVSFEITDEPLEDKFSQAIPDEISDQLEELYYLCQKNPSKAIAPLEKLRRQYPDIPKVYNFLFAAYEWSGDKAKAREAVLEMYRRHPDYLFAKVNYAEFCLQDGNYDKIAEIFDNKFDLALLYPDRKKFHISEVRGFYGIMGRYWLETGQTQAAKICYKLLRQIDPENEITKRLGGELMRKRFHNLLKKPEKE
jgi:tetratricopeptide (TPR) repeat protein